MALSGPPPPLAELELPVEVARASLRLGLADLRVDAERSGPDPEVRERARILSRRLDLANLSTEQGRTLFAIGQHLGDAAELFGEVWPTILEASRIEPEVVTPDPGENAFTDPTSEREIRDRVEVFAKVTGCSAADRRRVEQHVRAEVDVGGNSETSAFYDRLRARQADARRAHSGVRLQALRIRSVVASLLTRRGSREQRCTAPRARGSRRVSSSRGSPDSGPDGEPPGLAGLAAGGVR